VTDFVFDPFSRQAMTDPMPLYRVLRDEHPVYYSDKYDCFFVSRFEDNWNVLSDLDNTFPAPEGTGGVQRSRLLTHNDGPVPDPPLDFFTGISFGSPYYELARQAHGSQLRPGSVRKLEPFIRATARRLLDELLPRGRFDITQEYGGIVSASTICHLLRIPLDRAGEVLEQVNRTTLALLGDGEEEGSGIDPYAGAGLLDMLLPQVAGYRANRDGSWAIADRFFDLEIEGRKLSDAEIAGNLTCVLVGGTETLPKVIGHGLMELARRPAQLAAVRADLELNSAAAVEEMIRFCGPAQWFMRTAAKPTAIAGVPIRPGQRVIWLTQSAGRDPREFENPDEFIWNRPIPRTLAFGLGQRFCIGIHLARLEGRILVEEFLGRVADYDCDLDHAVRLPSSFQWGYNVLPVVIKS
jgi:cytochrome P450